MKTFPAFWISLAVLFVQSLQAPAPENSSVFQTYVYNGKNNLNIIIDGKQVDLNKAKVLSTTDAYKVVQPEDHPDVEIKIYNNGGVNITSRGNSSIQVTSGNDILLNSGTSEQVSEYVNGVINSTMEQLNAALANMEKTFEHNFPWFHQSNSYPKPPKK